MKKIFSYWFLFLLFASTTLVYTGCSSSVDEKHPAYREAIKYRDNNDMKKAVESMRRFLEIRPDSAKGHLELASMYDEHLDMPLPAIYHYQEFLRLSPKSPEVKTVLGWLDNVKRRYYEKMQIEFGDRDNIKNLVSQATSTAEQRDVLDQENQSLRDYVEKYKQAMAAQEKNVKTLQAQVDSVQADHNRIVSDLKRQLEHALNEGAKAKQEADTMKERLTATEKALSESEAIRKILEQSSDLTAPTASTTKPQTEPPPQKTNDDWVVPKPPPSTPAVEKPVVAQPVKPTPEKNEPANVGFEGLEVVTTLPTSPSATDNKAATTADSTKPPTHYIVQSGDSLSKISRKFYGTSSKFLLIYHANSDKMKSQNDLHPGQKLYIPSAE